MPRPCPLPPPLLGQPFTIKQAKAAGLTRRRARAQGLASPCHGVRIPASADLTLLVRARSLALATGAVASHLTAAALWGFPLPRCFETHEVVHLTCRRGGRAVRRKDVCGHQSVLLPDEIIEGRYVACTSPLRTWFDLAGVLGMLDLVIAGDFLLRRRNPLSTLAALDTFLATKEGRPGYRKAMKARALIRADTDSPKETELRLLLVGPVCPNRPSTCRCSMKPGAGSRTRTCPMKSSRSPSSTTAATTPPLPNGEATYSETRTRAGSAGSWWS
ncbi:hypothetical protein [Arthrobacter sp. ISL-5]|uniref:hypothetical protein n=1 Tax=Arthrobacter sp. ISL-5 TaxID=2819111 RepID=UPI002035C4A4|nr:hypothetical protein [Arthrobacter sp. ISL-5]